MRLSHVVTLSSRFQICIPKALRDAEGWKAGQLFAFVPKGNGVLVMPVPDRSELTGIAKGAKAQNYRDRSACP